VSKSAFVYLISVLTSVAGKEELADLD